MKRRIISMLLVLAMVFSVLPVMTFAAESSGGGSSGSNEGVVFTKTMIPANTLSPAKIKLEAYAEGSVTSETAKIPTDIVLVLDQSGSMDQTIGGRTKLAIMKEAVEEFVASVADMNNAAGDLYRVAVVGFASQSGYSNNTEILSIAGSNSNYYTYSKVTGSLNTSRTYYIEGSSGYTAIEYSYMLSSWYYGYYNSIDVNSVDVYSRTGPETVGVAYNSLGDTQYGAALVNCTSAAISMDGAIGKAVAALDGNGATRADLGLEMAANIFNKQPSGTYTNRKKVVVLITDGVPTTGSSFEAAVANSAVETAHAMKDAGATVFSMYLGTPDSNSVNFLQACSSNYPHATSYTVLGEQDATKYYSAHSDASAIKAMFSGIVNSISAATTLDKHSVVSDTLTEYFKLAADVSKVEQIEVYTADKTASGWAGEVKLESATVTIGSDNKTVRVKGFDFAANCVTETPKGGTGSTDYGKKLVIYIPVIEDTASDNFGGHLPTNAGAFIYQDDAATEPVVTATTEYMDVAMKYSIAAAEYAYHVDETVITEPVTYTVDFASIAAAVYDKMITKIPNGVNNAGVTMTFKLFDVGTLVYGNGGISSEEAASDDVLVAEITAPIAKGTAADVTDPALWTYRNYFGTSTEFNITIPAGKTFAEKVFVLACTLTSADGSTPPKTLRAYNYLDISVVRSNYAHIIYGVIDPNGKTTVADSSTDGIKGSLVGNTYTEAVVDASKSDTMTFTPNEGYEISEIIYLSSKTAPLDTAVYIYSKDGTHPVTNVNLDGVDGNDAVSLNADGSWTFTAYNVKSGVAVEVSTKQIQYVLTTLDDEGSEIIAGGTYSYNASEKIIVPFNAITGYSLKTLVVDGTSYDLTNSGAISALTSTYGAVFTYDGSHVIGGSVQVNRTQDHDVKIYSEKRDYKLTYQYYTINPTTGVYELFETEAAKTVEYGEKLSPSNLPNYMLGGVEERAISGANYTISEWFRNYETTGLSGIVDFASAVMPASDLVLHAVWNKNPDVKITDLKVTKTINGNNNVGGEFDFVAVFQETNVGNAEINLAAGTTSGEAVMTVTLTDMQADSFKAGSSVIRIREVSGGRDYIWIYDKTEYELRWDAENNKVVLYKDDTAVSGDTASFTNTPVDHDIAVTKTVENLTHPGAAMAVAGDTLKYTITVLNIGNVPTKKVEITDTFSGGEGPISNLVYPSDVTYSGGKFTDNEIPAGGAVVITYEYLVVSDDAGEVIRNTAVAELEDHGHDHTDSTETTVEKKEVKIVKSVDDSTADITQTLNYTIAVTNTGNVVLHNVEVTDTMTGATGKIAFNPVSNITYDGVDTFTIGTIGVGSTVNIHYTYTVPETDAGKTIHNAAVAEGLGGGDEEDVVVEPEDKKVSITKTASCGVHAAQINEIVVYSIAVTNEGNVTLTNVKIADTMTDGRSISTVALPGDVTYDSATRTFTVASIAPGKTAIFTYAYTIKEADAGKKIDNTVTVVDFGVSAAASIVVVDPDTSMDILKKANKSNVEIGGEVKYTITVTNVGNVTAHNIAVKDIMDDASGKVSFTDTANVTYSASDKRFVIKTLAPTATETITYTYTTAEEDAGKYLKNTAVVETDPDKPKSDVTVKVDDENPKVSIVKYADKSYLKVNDTATYTIIVKNIGNITLKNTVINDVMNGAHSEIKFTDNANVTYSKAAEAFTIKSLAVGATETITYTYTAVEADAGKGGSVNIISNTAVAEDIPGSSDEIIVEVEPEDKSISIKKSVDITHAMIDDIVTYTITVKNVGNVAVDDIVISDELAGAYGEIEFTDTARVTYDAAEEEFTVDGLAAGEELTFSYTYLVLEEDAGKQLINTAVVTSDPDKPTDKEEVDVEDPLTDFAIVKTSSYPNSDKGEKAKVGDIVTYTVKVTNRGNVTGGAYVTLKDTMTNASGKIEFTDTARITYDEDESTFTITAVAPEETVTFTYTYEILEADAGKDLYNYIVVTSDPEQPGDSEKVEVEDPDTSVTIDKTVDKVYAKIGDTVTYTIKVKHVGNVTAENIVIRDRMTHAAGTIDFTNTANVTYSHADSTFTIDELGVGEEEIITYTYRVLEEDAGRDIVNVVVVITDPDHPSDTEDIEIEDPDKSIFLDKTRDKKYIHISDIGTEDGVITYTIHLRNDGNVTVKDIVVSDKLTGAAGEIEFDETAYSGVIYDMFDEVFLVDELAPREEIFFSYTYTVQDADKGAQLINVAVVTSDPDQPSDTEEIDVEDPTTDFHIHKFANIADDQFAEIGEEIVYTVVVKNNSNDKHSNIRIADSLVGAAGLIEYDGNNAKVIYDPEEGLFIVDSLEAHGEETTFTYTYTVLEADAGRELENIVVVVDDPKHPSSRDEVEVEAPVYEFDIEKSADKAAAKVGETIVYTIEVTNNGNITVNDVKIRDVLRLRHTSGKISFQDNANVAYDASANIFTVKTIGVDETVRFSYSYKVAEADIGSSIFNTAVVITDPDHPNDTEVVEIAEPEDEITVNKSVNKTKADVGDELIYTVIVKNTGGTVLEDIIVTDEMLDTEEIIEVLLPGEHVTFTYTYKVQKSDEGKTLVNTAVAQNDDVYDEDDSEGTEIDDGFSLPHYWEIFPDRHPLLNRGDHYAYIVGYPDGTVRPEGNITRAEVATIFFRMMTEETREIFWETENEFSDVNSDDWYNNAISTLANAGIINGYPDGTYRPNNYITRAEFTKIAAGFFDSVSYTVKNPFVDVKSDEWYYSYVVNAFGAGLITGYPEGDFKPDAYITRAESMAVVNRTLKRHPDEDFLDEDMIVWPDNPEHKWYYADVQEATNSHSYMLHIKVDVTYETWYDVLPNRDWAALEKEWSKANSVKGDAMNRAK